MTSEELRLLAVVERLTISNDALRLRLDGYEQADAERRAKASEANRAKNSARKRDKPGTNSALTLITPPPTPHLHQQNTALTPDKHHVNTVLNPVVNGDLGATNPIRGFVSPLKPSPATTYENSAVFGDDDDFSLPVTVPLAPASPVGNSELTTSIGDSVTPPSPEASSRWETWPEAVEIAGKLRDGEVAQLRNAVEALVSSGHPDFAKSLGYLAGYLARSRQPGALLCAMSNLVQEGASWRAVAVAIERAGVTPKPQLSGVLETFTADAMRNMPGIGGVHPPKTEQKLRAAEIPVVAGADGNVDWRSMMQS